MSDQSFKPWFRAYMGWLGFYWWPVRWQGCLFALINLVVAGLSLALIVNNIVSPEILLLVVAIPVLLALRLFMNHTDWIGGGTRRQDDKRDIRN